MRAALILASVLAVALFTALGVWQVQRLGWKTALIAAVEARVAAPAVPATAEGGPDYTRLTVSGSFDPRQIAVKAVTAEGPGAWAMALMRTDAGFALWVNRGFVPEGTALPATPDRATVTGLVRADQPGGGFLRRNDPQAGRWFSRDTAAIGADLGLTDLAPYFIDAEAGPDAQALPIGGLTVVRFRNSHLVYAVTWFALAALWAGWLIYLRRSPGGTG